MAEALEDSRLLVINPGNVDSVVRNGPELAEAIVGKLLDRLKGSWETLYDWQCSHAWKGVRENVESGGSGGALAPWEVSAALGVEESTVRMILEKSRVPVAFLEVGVDGDRANTEPRRFESLRLVCRVRGPEEGDQPKLERAVQLSRDKYCSVLHTLRPDLDLEIRIERA